VPANGSKSGPAESWRETHTEQGRSQNVQLVPKVHRAKGANLEGGGVRKQKRTRRGGGDKEGVGKTKTEKRQTFSRQLPGAHFGKNSNVSGELPITIKQNQFPTNQWKKKGTCQTEGGVMSRCLQPKAKEDGVGGGKKNLTGTRGREKCAHDVRGHVRTGKKNMRRRECQNTQEKGKKRGSKKRATRGTHHGRGQGNTEKKIGRGEGKTGKEKGGGKQAEGVAQRLTIGPRFQVSYRPSARGGPIKLRVKVRKTTKSTEHLNKTFQGNIWACTGSVHTPRIRQSTEE